MAKRTSGQTNPTSALLVAALLLGSAAVAGAQTTQVASTDARWAPWIGCWQPVTQDGDELSLAPNKAAPVVCLIPTSGNGTVDLVTVNGAAAGEPEHIDATGQRRQVNREGCNGWETAQFSADAKRIYLHSQHDCAGNRTRVSSGIMSILPNGQWLDVQGVKVESHNGVRVVHYGRVPAPAALNADMKAALEGRNLATTTAVIAASDSVRLADVVDATRNADPLVVQTWLAQRGQGFNMDAKKLEQLADAKVPSNVIDIMVALSYPQAFAINLAQADGQMIQTQGQQVANADEGYRPGPTVFMDMNPFYGYGLYNSYYGYNYNGIGYGLGGPINWYFGTPVVIVRPSTSVDQPAADNRGKMVRGSGYTRPPDRTGGGSAGSPRGSTSGGSSTSSGGSRTSGGSSSGGEVRTAKPRP